ncbi:lipoxygenase 1, chloroplastic [Tanacetum coccineum]
MKEKESKEEDNYPYASDGLLFWEAIQNWVQTYVTRYYPDLSLVCNDRELQAWYAEVINVGHADLRYENWWPTLVNAEDLTAILTTIIWLASAQHAALNFVVDTLSTHSLDEEYICKRQQRNTWSGDAEMVEAFYGFASEIQRIEKEIEKQNRDMSLKNRCGTCVLPYELLAQSSEPGVTCRGIPNSVSILITFVDPNGEAFYRLCIRDSKGSKRKLRKRNRDMSLKNRCGACVLPYELLAQSSELGVTCRGIPNSINLSQLSVIGAAKVSHFEIICRALGRIPTKFDSLKNWNNRFLWIDALVFPLSTSWFSGTSVDKDPLSVDEAVDLPCVELLNKNRTLIRKYPETFLCFVGLSHSFTETETDVRPTLLHDNDEGSMNSCRTFSPS